KNMEINRIHGTKNTGHYHLHQNPRELPQLNLNTLHLFLPYCGWQWCVQLNYNSRVLNTYYYVPYTTRTYAIHIHSNSFSLGSTLTKENIDEMQKCYNTTHPQHEAISSAMSDVFIGHQGLSSACLQCSPAVLFQPLWLLTTFSLHSYVSHTCVQLDFV